MPEELNDTERALVALSLHRHGRSFFRWGHLLGWLILPLTALMFVPALKPYALCFITAAILLWTTWYFVYSTRVIGKLARGVGAPTPDILPVAATAPYVRRTRRRSVADHVPSSKQALALLLVPSAAITFVFLFRPDALFTPIPLHTFLLGTFACEVVLCLITGVLCMTAAYVVHFTMRDRDLSSRLIRLGASLGLWTMAGVVAYDLFAGAPPR